MPSRNSNYGAEEEGLSDARVIREAREGPTITDVYIDIGQP